MPTIAESAEFKAGQILDDLWVAEWADMVLPVDPVAIARSLGLQVLKRTMESDVSGALVKNPGLDPVIFINDRDGRERQRFTVAHEIGHYLRRESSPDSYSYMDRRDLLASTGTNIEERFANAFAAALLMPRRSVDDLEGLPPEQLAIHFQVSVAAMNNRLNSLKYRA